MADSTHEYEGPPAGGPHDDEAEAGRQYETARHLARAERRRIRLVVDFYPSGRISSQAWAPLGSREEAAADRPRFQHPRRPAGPAPETNNSNGTRATH